MSLLVDRRGVLAQPTAAPVVFPTTGLVGRLRADSLALADGAAVSSWPALVASAASGGGGASFKAVSAMNSQPAVRFTKANSNWLAWPSVPAGINPVSMFVMLRTPTGALQGGTPFGGGAGGVGCLYFEYDSSGHLMARVPQNSYYMITSSTPIASDASRAILLTWDDNASNVNNNFYVNNAVQTYSTRLTRTGQFATNGTNLGVDQWDSPDFLDAWIAEAAKWNHVLDATERAALAAYTLARYGV